MNKKKIENNTIIAWACDFDKITGEGKLARTFIENISINNKKSKILIYTPFDIWIKKNFYSKILKLKNFKKDQKISFLHKFIYPFQGLLFLNFKNNQCKKIYLNYVPLWNFIFFLFLKKSVLLGPITGSVYTKKKLYSFEELIRKFFIPILFSLSSFILQLKKKNLILSTTILENFFKKKKINNFISGYVVYDLIKKKLSKKIELINTKRIFEYTIYHRKHTNKNNEFLYVFIKKLLSMGRKVYVVGDSCNINGVYNLGFLNNNKLLRILKKTKYTILSGENANSFFALDCIFCGVKIFFNKATPIEEVFNKKFFFPLDYNNFKISSSKILQGEKKLKKINTNNYILKNKVQKKILMFDLYFRLCD